MGSTLAGFESVTVFIPMMHCWNVLMINRVAVDGCASTNQSQSFSLDSTLGICAKTKAILTFLFDPGVCVNALIILLPVHPG